jgi:diadenosine tetraphosphatase ApaH/serine/threonine PP2A family protein phosphatase
MEKPVAIISDIHSNLEALTAVLADIRELGVGSIFCLGDIVGYASGPRACLKAVRDLGCPTILGNHDEAVGFDSIPLTDLNDTAAAGVLFARERLNPAEKAFLTELPRELIVDGVQLTHASLAPLPPWQYILSEEDAFFHFRRQSCQLGFCGHTHRPMVWIRDAVGRVFGKAGKDVVALPAGGKVLVNVGAVGQPRDGDMRACYVLYRPHEKTVTFRRIGYDIHRTKRKVLRAGLPRFTAQRLSLGR